MQTGLITVVWAYHISNLARAQTRSRGIICAKIRGGAGKVKWLTVVSPEEPEGTQLLLEPYDWKNPAAKTYQEALFRQSIPAASFFVEDIQKEYARLKDLGVVFTMKPTKTTGSIIAVLDDTCGNLIQLTQLTWDMNKSDRAAP
jgi:hypothetical protein